MTCHTFDFLYTSRLRRAYVVSYISVIYIGSRFFPILDNNYLCSYPSLLSRTNPYPLVFLQRIPHIECSSMRNRCHISTVAVRRSSRTSSGNYHIISFSGDSLGALVGNACPVTHIRHITTLGCITYKVILLKFAYALSPSGAAQSPFSQYRSDCNPPIAVHIP